MRSKLHPGRFSQLLLFFLFVFVLQNTAVNSVICSRNDQCQDGDPETIDLCWVPFSTCLNVAKGDPKDKTYVLRNLTSIIDEANKTPLSGMEKREIVSTAAKIMAELNPHRFLHLNLLKVDIVEELHKFLSSLEHSIAEAESNVSFHAKMMSIFQKMNDRHTVYRPPRPLRFTWASTLFSVKQFFEYKDLNEQGKPRRRYVIADVAAGRKFGLPASAKGAEILKWNGEQIDAVVLRLGQEGYGSNKEAQISNALQHLSIRYLGFDPIPLKPFVDIQFRDVNEITHTITTPWVFFGMDRQEIRRTMRDYVLLSWKRAGSKTKQEKSENDFRNKPSEFKTVPDNFESVGFAEGNRTKVEVGKEFEDLFKAEIVPTKAGRIGHLTLPSFISNVSTEVVSEISRVLREMQKNGLVVGIRNNRGGDASYTKAVPEMVSKKAMTSQGISLRATDLILSLTLEPSPNNTEPEIERMDGCPSAVETALKVGEPFTGPFANMFGSSDGGRQDQVYTGPVVTLINGLTYSAGDLYAALQVDNNSSIVIGTSDNVGAGGASSVRYSDLARSFPRTLKPLPGGVDFTTSFLRFYRTGDKSGAIVENFAVKPHIRYYPTLNDAVNDECDLFEFLGKTLVSLSA